MLTPVPATKAPALRGASVGSGTGVEGRDRTRAGTAAPAPIATGRAAHESAVGRRRVRTSPPFPNCAARLSPWRTSCPSRRRAEERSGGRRRATPRDSYLAYRSATRTDATGALQRRRSQACSSCRRISRCTRTVYPFRYSPGEVRTVVVLRILHAAENRRRRRG